MIGRMRRPLVLPWALGALFVGGIVHISSVLLMPRFARNDAYARLGARPPGLALLPDPAVAQSMPFQDQRAEYGICNFDLDRGALRVRSNASPNALLTISFHDRLGHNFYSTTDRAALRGRLDVLLLTEHQLDTVEANDPEDQAPQELRLTPPTTTGFVLIRALIEEPGGREAARQAVGAAQCLTERE